MKTTSRFYTLFGFLAFGSALPWIYPALLIFYAVLGNMSLSFRGKNFFDLTFPLSTGLDVGGWMFVFFLALAIFCGAGSCGNMGKNSNSRKTMIDPEFLLTRALSRDDVYWVRMAIYWIMVSLPIVVIFAYAAWIPSCTFRGTKEMLDPFIQCFPSARIELFMKNDIGKVELPHGAMLVATWRAGLLVSSALLSQVIAFTSLLLRGKKRFTLWFFVFMVIAVGFSMVRALNFGFVMQHAIEFSAVVALLFGLNCLICRNIFRRVEF